MEYVKSIEKGEGTANNWQSKPDLPAGIQIPPSTPEIKEIEGELPVPEAVKSTMVTAVSDTEALEPKMIGKAKKHLDWPKWKAAIQAELDALTKTKTWQVVERPKGRNVLRFHPMPTILGQTPLFLPRTLDITMTSSPHYDLISYL